MKDAVLLELAARWEAEAKPPTVQDAPAEPTPATNVLDVRRIARSEGVEIGERQAKRECADTLRTLIRLLGEPS